jgi:hypothetical protein
MNVTLLHTWLSTRFPGKRARVVVSLIFLALLLVALVFSIELRSRYEWASDTLEYIEPRYERLLSLKVQAENIRQVLDAQVAHLSQQAYSASIPIDRVATDLQQRARGVAEKTGLSVITTTISPPRELGEVQAVSLAIVVQGTAGQLRDLLLELEQESPDIRVEMIRIQGVRGRSQAAGILPVQMTLTVLRIVA